MVEKMCHALAMSYVMSFGNYPGMPVSCGSMKSEYNFLVDKVDPFARDVLIVLKLLDMLFKIQKNHGYLISTSAAVTLVALSHLFLARFLTSSVKPFFALPPSLPNPLFTVSDPFFSKTLHQFLNFSFGSFLFVCF
ncbi:hypothetical protein RJT34_17622 [Clitoria ternatea]|uniref:Uncharacterized protein n=1 Tax=Clitoria ternatea TaxID=43366 RepID=A0AAN9J9N9_CLITE